METLWFYVRDGTRHRAYAHHDRLSTSMMGGPSSIPGSRTCRLEAATQLNYGDEKYTQEPNHGTAFTCAVDTFYAHMPNKVRFASSKADSFVSHAADGPLEKVDNGRAARQSNRIERIRTRC
jgi:hypothetical protein